MVSIFYECLGIQLVNASCLDWSFQHDVFNSVTELYHFASLEHGSNFELIEITDDNYSYYQALFEGSCNVL